MKRIIALMLSLVFILSLAGCAKDLEVSKNSVYVAKDGTVVAMDIDVFEKDYYSLDELTSYVNENIDDYNSSMSSSVVVDEVTEEEGNVKVKITYPSVTDYARVNDTVLFEGTVAEAKAAGYDLNTEYFVYNKGALKKKGSLNKESFTASDDNYVVVAATGLDVIVDGKVLAISAIDSAVPHVGDKGDRAGYDETELSSANFIVVYKR